MQAGLAPYARDSRAVQDPGGTSVNAKGKFRKGQKVRSVAQPQETPVPIASRAWCYEIPLSHGECTERQEWNG